MRDSDDGNNRTYPSWLDWRLKGFVTDVSRCLWIKTEFSVAIIIKLNTFAQKKEFLETENLGMDKSCGESL